MKEIVEAFAALARVTSASYVTVIKYSDCRFGVGLSHDSDAAARDTATALCIELGAVGNDAEEWLCGETRIGEIAVNVYGPHHKRSSAPDPEAVTAAVEQARKAAQL